MPTAAKFYWKSTCTSCRNAKAILKEKGIEVEAVDYARKLLGEETIAGIVKAVGGVEKVVNLRHEIAKKKGWGEKAPSEAVFVKAAASEPNLLRRPVLIRGRKVLVGFDKKNEAEWAGL